MSRDQRTDVRGPAFAFSYGSAIRSIPLHPDVTHIDDLSTGGIYALAEKDPFSLGSRRAIVAPYNPEYNTLRIYESLTTVHPDVVVVFKDMEEAYEFLNLKE